MRYKSLPLEQIPSWATFNNGKLHGVTISSKTIDSHGNNKGGGLLSTEAHSSGDVLLEIPSDLVLTSALVRQQALVDKHLREVLDAVGSEFSQVGLKNSRKAVMILLLMQLTHSSPDLEGQGVGVTSPLTQYVEFLPKDIPLPTFYTAGEREMLAGTSLAMALEQKTRSLEQEFEHLKASTENVEWCSKFWWSEDEGVLSIEVWKVVDSMYRSRALELPTGGGDAMVPVLDMANHASDTWNARFDINRQGNVLLVVRDERTILPGEEITITYGYGGACEMIFSYGFLEDNTHAAREMFLNLEMPADDPLAHAKISFAREAPGVRIYTDNEDQVRWDSAFVWWACVNQEDGLSFRVLQDTSGSKELKVLWKDSELQLSDDLHEKLLNDPLKDVFLLRATILVQQRVMAQGSDLADYQNDHVLDTSLQSGQNEDRKFIRNVAQRLKELELELLLASYQALEEEVSAINLESFQLTNNEYRNHSF